MTATTTLHIAIIEDHEGDGECGNCGRTGLRWIATLSDGSKVGVECAKKLLGYRPTTKSFDWVQYFRVEAEHVETAPNGEQTFWAMWVRKDGRTETRETRDGYLVAVGGVRTDWTKRGWL